MFLDLAACTCLILAGLLLVILSVIDLRVRLLPNIYVLPFALLGVVFHLTTSFDLLSSPHDMVIGGITGFMILFLLRLAGNHYYGQDTLGLGDVKLMGAGGLWLGVEGILIALTLGAMAGVIHGLSYAIYSKAVRKAPLRLSHLSIPAGPGFALGIAGVGIWYFHPIVIRVFHDVFSS
ncbi:MAG: prepilin peptidase [Alphaproteobacteria bacterium]|nr:prepilin peptidase [Alphaproteobacteria bacterium]